MQQRKKFLLVLPLLVLPSVLVLCGLAGVGRGTSDTGAVTTGLNAKLPDAHFKKGKEKDKLSLYEDLEKDSARFRMMLKKEPLVGNDLQQLLLQNAAASHSSSLFGKDTNEEKIMEKISLLKKITQSNREPAPISHDRTPDFSNDIPVVRNNPIKKEPDPELNQLNGMLDKIMLIQHPEKLLDSLQSIASQNVAALMVTASPVITTQASGFYGLDSEADKTDKGNTIAAVVEETQTLVSGAVVKLRLLQDAFIGTVVIARNQYLYGVSTLRNDRLQINVMTVRCGNSILPVSLDVYDLDGLAGIYVPGSMSRDASKESADQAMSGLALASLDPSVGAQAASAGIQAAKTLIGRKIKLVRMTIQSGYQVLLRNNSRTTH